MKRVILAIALIAIFASPVSAMNWQIEMVDDASSYCPYAGPNTGKYTSLAFDSSDNPAISYLYYNSHELKFTHYNNSSWEIETVDDAGQVGLYTSLEFDHSGNPAISYYDWLNGSLKFAYYNNSSWETETVDNAGLVGLHTSLAFDSSGNPAISYYDAYRYNTSLKFAYYNGGIWETETVDNIGDVGIYTSLAFDPSDNPAISYYDFNTSKDLKFAHYNGANWEIETVDSRLNVGMGTSLCYDPSGNPAISYLDVTNKELKFAHYNGEYWETETVGNAPGVWFDEDEYTYGGDLTSLAFDASGNPAISYNDVNRDDLKFAYYNGANWEIETVDSTNDVGRYASLCFDSSGNAGISYYDYTNPNNAFLKFAFCMTGTLPVNSSVPDAWVYVDGINRSVQANTTLYLWPGTYNITVVKQDYETPAIQTVNVIEGANPEINFIPEPAIPVAGFVANTTLETATKNVAFTDKSTGVISSWLWDFGDGTTSTEQTPTHNYISTGIYNVSLVLTNPSGSSTRIRTSYITVVNSPVASFNSNVTSGAAPLSVGFTDSSANSPTSWLWDFGDGNTSTEKNPIHTYSSVGNYNVSLNASNDLGSNTTIQLSYITTAIAPVTNFTANVTSGTAPLIVNFTDNSTNDPTAWLWDFGDGTTSTSRNASHTYSSAGTYDVSLNASNAGGSNISTRTEYITAAITPVTNFTADKTSGTAPLKVNFTENSTNEPTAWLWDFGDGTTSTSRNVSHTYSSAGTYDVSLNASNVGGSNISTKTEYITAAITPVTNFTADKTSGTVPLTVNFTENSTNEPTAWLWDFGDGTTSTSRNENHTYSYAGTYDVSLNASNAGGSNISTRTEYITVSAASTGSSSGSSLRISTSPNQVPDTTISTDNTSEELPEESFQNKENVSFSPDEEQPEEKSIENTANIPGFGALAGIAFASLALLVLRKNK